MKPQQFLTAKEVKKLLKISESTFRNLLDKGALKPAVLNEGPRKRLLRFTEDEIVKYQSRALNDGF